MSDRDQAIQAAELLYQARGLLERNCSRGGTHCWCVRLAHQAEVTGRTILGALGLDPGTSAEDADRLKLKVLHEPAENWLDEGNNE